jgi:hypothetical protein
MGSRLSDHALPAHLQRWKRKKRNKYRWSCCLIIIYYTSDCCNGQGGVAAALHWAVCHYCRCFPSQTTFIYNTPVNTHKSCVILRRPNHTHTNTCALFMYIVQHRWYIIKTGYFGCVENRSAAYFLWRLHLSCGSDTSQQTSWHATEPADHVQRCWIKLSRTPHTHTPTKSRPTDGAAACV